MTGEELILDFQDQLYVWKEPKKPTPPVFENGRIVRAGDSGHSYSIGVDISSSESEDFSSIQVIDCDTQEQVAEMNLKVLPSTLLYMIDWIGRWYNGAFVVPERAGMGIQCCQDLYNIVAYTNVFKMKKPDGKPTKKVGFPTAAGHKPSLIKHLLDYVGFEEGVLLKSRRLWNQLAIYVNLGLNKTGHVEGPGNHDDMVMSLCLGLVGIREAVQADHSSLLPAKSDGQGMGPFMSPNGSATMDEMITQGGNLCLMPLILSNESSIVRTREEEMLQFAATLGGLPMHSKHTNLVYRKNK